VEVNVPNINLQTTNKGTMKLSEREIEDICDDIYGKENFLLLEEIERIQEKAEEISLPNEVIFKIEDIIRDEVNSRY